MKTGTINPYFSFSDLTIRSGFLVLQVFILHVDLWIDIRAHRKGWPPARWGERERGNTWLQCGMTRVVFAISVYLVLGTDACIDQV